MKTQCIQTVTESGDDITHHWVIAESDLEVALLRCAVETEVTPRFHDALGREWVRNVGEYADGWFALSYMTGSPLALMETAQIMGRVRVIERPGPPSEAFRFYAEWEFSKQDGPSWAILHDQANHGPYAPVVACKQRKDGMQ